LPTEEGADFALLFRDVPVFFVSSLLKEIVTEEKGLILKLRYSLYQPYKRVEEHRSFIEQRLLTSEFLVRRRRFIVFPRETIGSARLSFTFAIDVTPKYTNREDTRKENEKFLETLFDEGICPERLLVLENKGRVENVRVLTLQDGYYHFNAEFIRCEEILDVTKSEGFKVLLPREELMVNYEIPRAIEGGSLIVTSRPSLINKINEIAINMKVRPRILEMPELDSYTRWIIIDRDVAEYFKVNLKHRGIRVDKYSDIVEIKKILEKVIWETLKHQTRR
jgi:hypothetical protein